MHLLHGLAFLLLAADQFVVVIPDDLLLFIESISEHIVAIEANLDIVSDPHHRTEIGRLSEPISIEVLAREVARGSWSRYFVRRNG